MYVEGVTPDGIGVYTGSVIDTKNIVVSIGDGRLHVLTGSESSHPVWTFNEDEDGFEAVEITGTGISAAIVNGAGLRFITGGAGEIHESISKNDVSFKLIPAN